METLLLSNAAAFFTAVRVDLFGGAIEQTQVDGINSILQAWPEGTDPRFVAYGLATAYHETARTMEPIAEWGQGPGQGLRHPLRSLPTVLLRARPGAADLA